MDKTRFACIGNSPKENNGQIFLQTRKIFVFRHLNIQSPNVLFKPSENKMGL